MTRGAAPGERRSAEEWWRVSAGRAAGCRAASAGPGRCRRLASCRGPGCCPADGGLAPARPELCPAPASGTAHPGSGRTESRGRSCVPAERPCRSQASCDSRFRAFSVGFLPPGEAWRAAGPCSRSRRECAGPTVHISVPGPLPPLRDAVRTPGSERVCEPAVCWQAARVPLHER